MGRHKKRARSSKSISKEHFPVGDLARRRKEIRAEYLASCDALQAEEKKLKNSIARVG